MSQAPQRPVSDRDQAAHAAPDSLRWASGRALGVAVVLSLIVSAWTKQAELVTLTSQVSESTPPIASILALFLVLGLGAAFARLAGRLEARRSFPGLARLCRRLTLTPGEMLVVFVFLAITSAMPGVGLFRQVMPCLMVTQYFGTPADHLDEMATHIPRQWAPNDPEAARVFWEGEGRTPPSFGLEELPVVGPPLAGVVRFFTGPAIVPWGIWLVPFAVWSLYLSAYFISAFCLVTLFRRYWEDDERLTFPVSSFAVEMLRPEGSLLSGKSFFRDPVVWTGFSLAVLYNVFNILKVFNPAVPALGISYPLGNIFTESPWDTMRGFSVFYKPEILGLGYLVPSDVLLSIWFFTLAGWFVRPFAKMAGYSPPGFPFLTNQAMGAFVLLGIYFIYQGRHRLLEVARKAFGGAPDVDDRGEPFRFRVTLLATICGMVVVFGMPIMFGVDWWASAVYFGIMFLVLIVYCRNRAEMGFPIVWGYPLYMQRATIVSFLGSAPLVRTGHVQSLTLLTMFSWLQRSVNQAMTSIGQESYVAAHRLGGRRRTLARVVVSALVFGLVTAFLVNLSAYYEHGGLVLSSPGGIEGGQMTQEVLGQFRAVSQWIERPEPPNTERIGYTMAGFVIALLLILGRRASVRFPFHAGGYALAYTHASAFMWFPAFVLWITKTLTIHIGGVGLYRRIAPGFLAFTLGHFFSVGVWSLAGIYAGEWVRRYIVWFL